MNLNQEVQNGLDAQKIIENPLVQNAFNSIRAGIIEKWRSCPIRDKEGQHELKLMDKLLTDLEGYFKTVIESGKMAEFQLENEKKVAKLHKAGIMR